MCGISLLNLRSSHKQKHILYIKQSCSESIRSQRISRLGVLRAPDSRDPQPPPPPPIHKQILCVHFRAHKRAHTHTYCERGMLNKPPIENPTLCATGCGDCMRYFRTKEEVTRRRQWRQCVRAQPRYAAEYKVVLRVHMGTTVCAGGKSAQNPESVPSAPGESAQSVSK